MRTVSDIIPRNAGTLNEESYSTLDPLMGNRLTVTLERPQKVIQVEVLTGPEKQGLNRPRQGQVELGCAPVENSKGCARCSLLVHRWTEIWTRGFFVKKVPWRS